MANGSSDASEWEYAKRTQHTDFSDAPFWGPSFATQLREGYTAQEWGDLVLKRSMNFVVQRIPKMNEWLKEEHLEYDHDSLVDCNVQIHSQMADVEIITQ